LAQRAPKKGDRDFEMRPSGGKQALRYVLVRNPEFFGNLLSGKA